MNIESLPSRNDRPFAEAAIAKIGWRSEPCGPHLLVYPRGDDTNVLLSALSYQWLGMWLRPVYAKIEIETDVDLRLVSIPLLRFGFSETGSVSLLGADEAMKRMTICYRVLVPSEAEAPVLASAVFAADLAKDDIAKIIRHYHDLGGHRD